jgi:3-deoxy-D-arabino-heptulosonate 7-phosphate (DAHP) synthase
MDFKYAKKNNENTIIKIDDIKIGDGSKCIIAGPCSIENEKQIIEIAKFLKKS